MMTIDKNEVPLPPIPITSATSYQAIDFQSTYKILDRMIEYITETRVELEKGTPDPTITTLLELCEQTRSQVHELENKHINNLLPLQDELTEEMHDALLREQDTKLFDAIMSNYTKAQKAFDEYYARSVRQQ